VETVTKGTADEKNKKKESKLPSGDATQSGKGSAKYWMQRVRRRLFDTPIPATATAN
jgi:hypothetical protein